MYDRDPHWLYWLSVGIESILLQWQVLLFVFVSVAALDFVWAKYTVALQREAHGWAAFLAGGIFLLNGLAVLVYVESPWLLVPAVMGAVVGTYAGSRITQR